MKIEQNGITIELEFDEDGFPEVNISTGGNYYAANFRPCIEVTLNNISIHRMFNEDDERWNK